MDNKYFLHPYISQNNDYSSSDSKYYIKSNSQPAPYVSSQSQVPLLGVDSSQKDFVSEQVKILSQESEQLKNYETNEDHMSTHSSTYPYIIIDLLGRGTYGVVYEAIDSYGNRVALKKISLENQTEGIPSTALREISTMKEINHPNVLRLYNVIASSKSLTVAFELADLDLKHYMDIYRAPLSYRRTKSFMYQLLQGISHIHQLMILHRDIKPQNLLVFSNGLIKIADFGLSRAFSVPVNEFNNEVVTLWYRPPDVLLGNKNYDTGVDIWSIGCVFAEHRPLFLGQNPGDQLKKIFQVLGTPTESQMPDCHSYIDWKLMAKIGLFPKVDLWKLVPHADADALDLLEKMLVYDGKSRISARDALSHPYFTRSSFEIAIPLLTEHVKQGRLLQKYNQAEELHQNQKKIPQ